VKETEKKHFNGLAEAATDCLLAVRLSRVGAQLGVVPRDPPAVLADGCVSIRFCHKPESLAVLGKFRLEMAKGL